MRVDSDEFVQPEYVQFSIQIINNPRDDGMAGPFLAKKTQGKQHRRRKEVEKKKTVLDFPPV